MAQARTRCLTETTSGMQRAGKAMAAFGGIVELFINIDVDDLEKGIAFYEKGLGLQLTRRLFDGTVAEMAGVSSVIYLIEAAGDRSPVTGKCIRRDYGRHWTPVHLDFVVEDLRASVARAAFAGGQQEGEIQSFNWGLLATMSDPFGHGFCLLQLTGKGYQPGE